MNNFNNEQVELFICRLIDKYEGTIITEEFLQDQYVKLLNEQKNQLEKKERKKPFAEARVRPCGLNDNDTIEDALQRADDLAGVDWHSGSM